MSAALKPIADEYLRETHTIKPGDRLHRLISRMADTHYDDLTDDRIEQLERQVDEWRWMHASGARLDTTAEENAAEAQAEDARTPEERSLYEALNLGVGGRGVAE